MRCTATVTDNSVTLRSRHSPTDPQCQRVAVENGLCRQHAAIRWCQTRGCDRNAVGQEGDWWFCRAHGRRWADHNRIVERILRITPRD